jgi:hypothetical protein
VDSHPDDRARDRGIPLSMPPPAFLILLDRRAVSGILRHRVHGWVYHWFVRYRRCTSHSTVLGCLLCLIPHSEWLKDRLRKLLDSYPVKDQDAPSQLSKDVDVSCSSSHGLVPSEFSSDRYEPNPADNSTSISSIPTEPLQRNLPIPGDKKSSKYSTAGAPPSLPLTFPVPTLLSGLKIKKKLNP